MKSFITIALSFLTVYGLGIAYAASTQSVVQPSDISADYICIKDTMPDAYICLPKAENPVPWYLNMEHDS